MTKLNIRQPEVLQRAWGTETVVVRTPTHAGKILVRQPDTERPDRGFQMHVKEESHFLYEGRMLLETWDPASDTAERHEVTAGSGWTVPPCTFHRETALTDCVIVEVGDPTSDDRYRSGEDYGGLVSMTDVEANQKLLDLAAALRVRAAECESLAFWITYAGLASFKNGHILLEDEDGEANVLLIARETR